MPAAIGLLIIGDEILSGRHLDKHLTHVIEALDAHHLKLAWSETIGDDPARITATLKRLFATGDLIFSTGGIGATPDDHTRQCAAAALGVPVVGHAEAQRLIAEHTRSVALKKGEPWEPERADNLQRLKMGEFPQGAQLVPNPYNHIPGFWCQSAQGARIYFVPGFPVMAWPMIDWAIEREIAAGLGGSAWLERSVIVYGSGEAVLTPVMERIERDYPGITVFSLPSVDDATYGVHIDLGVKGGNVAQVDAAFDDLKARIEPLGLRFGPDLTRS
ncbi:MAG: competence/damage-inducible protein A [Burkholderiaceae bacterium]|nr:MAG: competence/damage-inducible protein A [Burkholderiaceae bacterium]